jgi:hypothetical protein
MPDEGECNERANEKARIWIERLVFLADHPTVAGNVVSDLLARSLAQRRDIASNEVLQNLAIFCP